MSSLYLLVPLALLMVSIAATILVIAVKRGQYDDLQRYEGRLPDDL